MKQSFRMVVSHHPDPGVKERDPLWFGQRVARKTAHIGLVAAERVAITKFAKGRAVYDHWTPTTEEIRRSTKRYSVYVGMFMDGVYKGRSSTYHSWRVADTK